MREYDDGENPTFRKLQVCYTNYEIFFVEILDSYVGSRTKHTLWCIVVEKLF